MWENTTPGTELPSIFCAGIGPLQLGVVLVLPLINLLKLKVQMNNVKLTWNSRNCRGCARYRSGGERSSVDRLYSTCCGILGGEGDIVNSNVASVRVTFGCLK